MLKDPDFKVVQVCKEDEGVSICSALYCTGHRSLLLMQYTGLLDSVNAIRASAMEGENPVCMMVGMLLKEPGIKATQSKHYGVRIVEPVLDAMGIEHHMIETPDAIAAIVPSIEKAYASEKPVVLLIGTEAKMSVMKRDECLKVLARHRTDEIVVAVFTAAQELLQIAPHELNYTFYGLDGPGFLARTRACAGEAGQARYPP